MSSSTAFFRRNDLDPAGAGPQVYLAAFGKHPGWDDHMDDIGLETEVLFQTKKLLYTEGLRGQIEAGDPHSWNHLEKNDPEALLPQFQHLFLWQRGAQLVAGRLWSSRDGKGRTRYPMVVCAHCTGLPLHWVIHRVLPCLDDVRQACVATESADEVRRILQHHSESLRTEAAGARPDALAEPGLEQEMGAFLSRPELGPDREGLLRILYEVRNKMAGFERSSGTRTEDPKPAQIRLPRCADDPGAAVVRWRRFFELQLAPSAPLLILAPVNEPWIDVTVGEPAPAEFFCLRANLKALPVASSIPYKIPDPVKQRCEQVVTALLSGLTSLPGSAQVARNESGQTLWGTIQKVFSGGKGTVWLLLGVVAALAIAVPLTLRKPAPEPAATAKPGIIVDGTTTARGDPGTLPIAPVSGGGGAPAAPPASPPPTAPALGALTVSPPPPPPAPSPAPAPAAAPTPLSPTPAQPIIPGTPLAVSASPAVSAPEPTPAATPQPDPAITPNAGAVPATPAAAVPQSVPVANVEPPAVAPLATPKAGPDQSELRTSLGMVFAWVAGLPGTPDGGWVGKHEVTQEQFEKVTGANPSFHSRERARTGGYEWSAQLPVENISLQQALDFCAALTRTERADGHLRSGWTVTLPTRAQWDFFLADAAFDQAVTSRERPYGQEWKAPFRVGQRSPNRFGLHDVLGNVWEWCRDDSGAGVTFKGSAFNSRRAVGLGQTLTPAHAEPSDGRAPDRVGFQGAVGFRCVIVPGP
jgi:hypothetical protein